MGEDEKLLEAINETNKRLTAIESLLQRLPEIQAAVFIQMYEEYEIAKFQGLKAADIWDVIPPGQR